MGAVSRTVVVEQLQVASGSEDHLLQSAQLTPPRGVGKFLPSSSEANASQDPALLGLIAGMVVPAIAGEDVAVVGLWTYTSSEQVNVDSASRSRFSGCPDTPHTVSAFCQYKSMWIAPADQDSLGCPLKSTLLLLLLSLCLLRGFSRCLSPARAALLALRSAAALRPFMRAGPP